MNLPAIYIFRNIIRFIPVTALASEICGSHGSDDEVYYV
jgi:hypothetical protein